MTTSFIKVTLANNPDFQVIIPKSKVIEIKGNKPVKGESVLCEITYETRGNIGIITVVEDISEVFRLLHA